MKDFIGFGALGEALQSLEDRKYARVFVVASQSGWRRFTAAGDRNFFSNKEMLLFSDFSVNPDIADILKGADSFRRFAPDLIVALGGGSPIDVAKVIKAAVFTRAPFDPASPSDLVPSGDGPPLVAISTTAGSGSEATRYAVFYKGDAKQSLAHPSIRPEMAVVDPELSYSMPPDQTAATGFDALSQAVEGYWAASTTEEAQALSTSAIRYILPHIERAVRQPDPASRYNMAQAAYLAGKAIDVTRTTLPHALAYHLTKRYGLPHGHAVALTLPYFFILNMEDDAIVTAPFGREGHRRNMEGLFALLRHGNGTDSFHFWRSLLRRCGLAFRFADIGLTSDRQFDELVRSASPERVKNHPVMLAAENIATAFKRYD